MASTDTAKEAQLMELLKKEVRAMLIAAKEGLTPAELEEQYMAMVCKPLPLQDLGFQSTLELVRHMPEVVRVSFCKNGTLILKAIADDSTKGIAKLVACQKGRTCSKAWKRTHLKANAASPCMNSKNPQRSPLRAKTPVLPATVKAELQDLLSSSPLLLQDLDKAFLKCFGRAFPYRQYGFSSVLEALRSVSDFVVVEQAEAGSLLVLRQCLANEAEQEEVPHGEAQDEEMLRAEMPPLEPVCETDNFHQAALHQKWEPVETQAVDLSDRLEQPQDCQQLLPNKLTLTEEILPDAVQDRSLCSLPPLKRRSLVGVVVEFVVSPTQFYVHICGRETSHKLQDLMFEMRHLYSHKLVSDKYIMPDSAVRPGQLCCVMVSKWWYRVIIHRVISDQEVEVFYADYGHLQIVQKSWLRFLKWQYLKLPAQAIPCSLAWVKPVEGTWSPAATLLFKNLCGSKELVGVVDEYMDGVLHLFLCDTSTKEDVYFHSVLRDMGYADVCGENIPSQEFKELNPLALYVQPSGEQENAELVEPDLCLQQESLVADSETTSSKLDGAELCDQTPHSFGESSVPAVLVKSAEDLYTSFIYSKQQAEMRQDDPDQIERFLSKAQLSEAVHPAVLLMAMPVVLDTPNSEENMKNEDLPRSWPLWSQPHRLHVPPATLSAVLAAARLATSHAHFQWLPSLGRQV
ncbi:LOW QUALITY PROTEIN: tudor domain-containing protein 5 [Chiroxiphia lanceolata]|uniref:LOW QUALITY PROTEIN: tudor domain-containing protein 5 n=1 Tax=Chiroxiphia lanceolata TaxID=296741 RepID=UPI0013CE92AE|nr:LOW QUALITY PROTEIN: tudor domain-containing protein 5 [Chiroxiphia lanceolata]